MKKIKLLTVFAVIIAQLVCVFSLSGTASADSIDIFTDKYKERGLLVCYNKALKRQVPISDSLSVDSLIKDDFRTTSVVGLYPGSSSGTNDQYTCSELLADLGVSFGSEDSAAGMLRRLGYSLESNQRCATFNFQYLDPDSRNSGGNGTFEPLPSPKVCSTVKNDGTVEAGSRLSIINPENPEGSFTVLPGSIEASFSGDGTNKTVTLGYYAAMYPYVEKHYRWVAGENWVNMMNDFSNEISSTVWTHNINGNGEVSENGEQPIPFVYYSGINIQEASAVGGGTYSFSDWSVAANTAYKSLFGASDDLSSALKLSNAQKIGLYESILASYYKISSSSCNADRSAAEANAKTNLVVADDSDPSGWHLTRLHNGSGNAMYCYVRAEQNIGEDVYGFKGALPAMVDDGKTSFPEIVKWLLDNGGQNIDSSYVLDGALADNTGSAPVSSDVDINADENVTKSDLQGCFDGSSSLGWILCPLIEGIQSAATGLYDAIIEPFLAINVSAFDTNNGVYQGWQFFQSLANVVFVIIFLIAIFSQITGFGIDNYGIKRLLPKLIIAAILVNLSYIICMVLVDISNIVGYGSKTLFDNINITGVNASGGRMALTTFISGATIVGTGAIAGATAPMWGPALIIPFLLGLIGVVISIVFMFIMLGIRQAGVIILVVVSPLAIVMYMLPNTKRIFDRWKQILQGLLLLYPICGLLIGGSEFAGDIIASTSDGFWISLLGALLSVVPFFLIPTLLRGSMSAMGNLGARLSNIGQGIGRGAQNIAKQTPAFKNLGDRVQLAQRNNERRRLEGIARRINRTPENARTEGQKRRLALAQSQLNKMTQEDVETDVGVKPLDAEQARTAAISRRFNTEVDAIKLQNVNSGVAGRTGDMKDDAFAAGAKFEDGSLAAALYNADTDEARYAAVSQLMESGHHGEQALHQVMQRLSENGRNSELRTIARAAKNDKNFGGLKGASRSTYDYINDIEQGGVARGADGVVNPADVLSNRIGNTKFGNMSQESLVATNREELQRYAAGIKNGTINAEQAKTLSKLASDALNNERLRSRVKGGVDNDLNAIIAAANADATTGDADNSGGGNSNDAAPDQEFKVNQNPSSTNADGYQEYINQNDRRGPNQTNSDV